MGFDLREKIKFKEMENNDLIFSVVMRKNRRDALNIIKYCIYNYLYLLLNILKRLNFYVSIN